MKSTGVDFREKRDSSKDEGTSKSWMESGRDGVGEQRFMAQKI